MLQGVWNLHAYQVSHRIGNMSLSLFSLYASGKVCAWRTRKTQGRRIALLLILGFGLPAKTKEACTWNPALKGSRPHGLFCVPFSSCHGIGCLEYSLLDLVEV